MSRLLLPGWVAMLDKVTAHVSPAQACQGVFALLIATTLAVNSLPTDTKKHLLDYGARTGKAASTSGPGGKKSDGAGAADLPRPQPSKLERFAAALAARIQVPHSWFISLYVVYLVSTIFWVAQWWIWQHQDTSSAQTDNLFGRIVAGQVKADLAAAISTSTTATAAPAPASSMGLTQVYLALGFEAVQTGRRLYEYLFVFKRSKSKMNIVQCFAVGWTYYLCMSVSVWVEGSQAILAAKQRHASLSPAAGALQAKLIVGTVLYLLGWLGQYRCHVHLAGLKKYTLPDDGLFRYLVCPHYSCELLLYVGMSILAAPEGRLFNRTLLSSLLFSTVCLSVTADRTRKWYGDKFGAERVAKKWRIIPFVY